MPMIKVEMFAGRTLEQKRELAKELSETFTRIAGGNPDGVEVRFIEVAPEDWARGGQLFSDKMKTHG